MMEKNCTRCKEEKNVLEFQKDRSRKDGIDNHCKKCRSELQKKRYSSRKKEVIEYYGGKCECCGETNFGFLTIDHINNDGHKELRRGVEFYRLVINSNFPDNLRILCWNCNCGRQFNSGVCPHKSVNI